MNHTFESEHGRLRITLGASGEQVHIELTTEQGHRLAACSMPADLIADLIANGGGIAAVAQLYPAPKLSVFDEPTPSTSSAPRGWTPGDTYGDYFRASGQVRDYFRTVKADIDAEYPDPVADELPDTDIRGAMAGELERMGLMTERIDNSDRSDTGDMT